MKTAFVKYCNEDKSLCIEITKEVLSKLLSYRQNSIDKLEAGGQLFAQYHLDKVLISYATKPSSKDIRKRNLFKPHIPTWKKNTKELYKKGYHYIGDWHTHAEDNPRPSYNDIDSIHSRFNVSEHELVRMIIIIVGKDSNLYVGLSDGQKITELT
jgi:integrative and conjugative element protein (TIGR02256 family)